MKNSIIAALLIFAFVVSFSQLNLINSVRADSSVDSYFDSYSNISWEDEKARLENFASRLILDPKMIGYIAFYIGKKESSKGYKSRINRVRKYLIGFRKIEKRRIVIIDAGKREESFTILQPIDKDSPKPEFRDAELEN